jgi:predicted PurR-regulated permease PerM
MAKKIRGITIELGADASGLEKALTTVNSSIRSTQSQLRDVNKLLKLDPGNSELLAQKQSLLAQAVENTSQKLKELKSAAEIANQKLENGEISSNQYAAIQREIVSCENELKKLENQTSQFGSVSAQKLAAVGDKFTELGSKIQAAGAKLTIVSAAIVAVGANMVSAASNLEESMNKVEVVFGDASGRVKEFAETTLESAGIAEGNALDMAALYGDMATSMGLTTDSAADMSMSLVQLAGDVASFKNVSLDTATNALKGIFTGEGEALKNLGVVMNETTLSAYAMENGFNKSYNTMSQAEKVALRYQYVMESLGSASGDFERTSDGTANSIRVFQESLTELSASFGEVLLPIITPIIQKLTKLLQVLENLPGPVKTVIVVVAMIVSVIGPVLVVIGTLMGSIGNIIKYLPTIVTGLQGIGSALTTSVIPAISAATKAVITFVAANPEIILIIAALALLGIAIYEIVQHWDELSEACASAWDKIKTTVAESPIGKHFIQDINEIKAAFEDAGGGIKGVISGIGSAIKNGFETYIQIMFHISDETMKKIEDTIVGTAKKIVDYFKSIPNKIAETWNNCINKIKDAWDNLIPSAKKWGNDLVDNFTNGINEKSGNIQKNVKSLATEAENVLGKVQSSSNSMSTMTASTSSVGGYEISSQSRQENVLGSMQKMLGSMANTNTTVNVVLQGDAKGVFRLVRQENQKMIKTTGYNALA